jgi:hypothetical protein
MLEVSASNRARIGVKSVRATNVVDLKSALMHGVGVAQSRHVSWSGT